MPEGQERHGGMLPADAAPAGDGQAIHHVRRHQDRAAGQCNAFFSHARGTTFLCGALKSFFPIGNDAQEKHHGDHGHLRQGGDEAGWINLDPQPDPRLLRPWRRRRDVRLRRAAIPPCDPWPVRLRSGPLHLRPPVQLPRAAQVLYAPLPIPHRLISSKLLSERLSRCADNCSLQEYEYWLDLFNFNIVDTLKVPDVPGEYVLSFRWGAPNTSPSVCRICAGWICARRARLRNRRVVWRKRC